ncbi:MAG TPA: phosphomannomutase/phosphoglucomutase [Candidatus Limnocylindria bacterium]|nr:phosphomannomutase/phosphoglucomutase [Candidatus Limnocylindria bacterium]
MIPGHIFREYDIRGLHESELTDATAEAIGRAFGTMVRRERGARVALGRDVRPSSERLARAVERGMTACGITVERVGLVPTPALYYAVAATGPDAGIQITGSHNPPEFNGFKMTLRGRPVFGADIQGMRAMIERNDFEAGTGSAIDRPVLDAYRAMLVERLKSPRGLTVVMDCGNGCAGTVVPESFERMGHTVIPLFAELDGRFPNHLPDPTVPALMRDLTAEVRRRGADLGIGFDGDADRIGAVDGRGNMVFGDQLLALFARDVLSRVPGAEILFDVKCSQGLIEDIAAHGGRPSMWKTGHSLIKSRLLETGAPLAGEMSGHMFFKEGFFGFDDALFAAGRLLRYVAASGKRFDQLVASIPHYFATPEMRLACPEQRKFAIVEELKREFAARYRVIDIDGARVEFGDGWGLVRASNTQPVLVVRFEARTPERLEEIRAIFMEPLRRLGVGEPATAH